MFTNQNKIHSHSFFMQLALKQAEINIGNTNENPSVGCVIVKNNNLISAGFTSKNGRPHAEHNAIKNSKVSLNNAYIYTTLEPCSHYGKTYPCVHKIIKKKIRRVYFAVKDPDRRSYNVSTKKLKKKGIKVSIGINLSEVKNFYKSYFLYKESKLPFVTCKLAASKDYLTINKKKAWITNPYSRGRVHLMRSKNDCIVTSSQTIIKDNPLLNCRINGLEKRSPVIMILDNKMKVPLDSKIFKSRSNLKIIIFYNVLNKKKANFYKKKNIKLIKIDLNEKNNNLDLIKTLLKISELGFQRVFVEGGCRLVNSFLLNNLVNNFSLFISKNKLKKNGSGSIKNYFNTFLKKKNLNIEKVNLFGDKLLTYKIK